MDMDKNESTFVRLYKEMVVLQPVERIVFATMWNGYEYYKNNDKTYFKSIKDLVKECNVSESTIKRTLKNLRSMGLLICTKVNKGANSKLANEYELDYSLLNNIYKNYCSNFEEQQETESTSKVSERTMPNVQNETSVSSKLTQHNIEEKRINKTIDSNCIDGSIRNITNNRGYEEKDLTDLSIENSNSFLPSKTKALDKVNVSPQSQIEEPQQNSWNFAETHTLFDKLRSTNDIEGVFHIENEIQKQIALCPYSATKQKISEQLEKFMSGKRKYISKQLSSQPQNPIALKYDLYKKWGIHFKGELHQNMKPSLQSHRPSNTQNEDDKFFNALFEPNEHEQRLYDMAEREKKAREARQTNQTIQIEDVYQF